MKFINTNFLAEMISTLSVVSFLFNRPKGVKLTLLILVRLHTLVSFGKGSKGSVEVERKIFWEEGSGLEA